METISADDSLLGDFCPFADLSTPSSRSSRPPMMVRQRGAGLFLGAYCGRRGAEVILLVSTLISKLGCTMVILMLKGATSYARL